MTLITKPDFTYVWASGGAVVAPNDAKKQQGWVAEAPPFQYDNWLQNRQDQMLAHINQRGIPAWDALTNYEASSLSYVQGSDGKIYKSVAASGPSATVQNPTTDGTDTYWTVAFADVGAFLTQAAGDTRYAQRANNLSDVTSASTAFTNIKQPASETVTGVVELATIAEVQTGTDTSRAVTSAGVASVTLGMGQTWQDVTGSRATATTYTNSTGRPIQVLVSQELAGNKIDFHVNGLKIGTIESVSSSVPSISFIVPNGNTYQAIGDPFSRWSELR